MFHGSSVILISCVVMEIPVQLSLRPRCLISLSNRIGVISVTLVVPIYKMKHFFELKSKYEKRNPPVCVPWIVQSSIQIQQNSNLHILHVMWLHPWFFSILVLHFGHFLVFAKIQLAVCEGER